MPPLLCLLHLLRLCSLLILVDAHEGGPGYSAKPQLGARSALQHQHEHTALEAARLLAELEEAVAVVIGELLAEERRHIILCSDAGGGQNPHKHPVRQRLDVHLLRNHSWTS